MGAGANVVSIGEVVGAESSVTIVIGEGVVDEVIADGGAVESCVGGRVVIDGGAVENCVGAGVGRTSLTTVPTSNAMTAKSSGVEVPEVVLAVSYQSPSVVPARITVVVVAATAPVNHSSPSVPSCRSTIARR